MTAHKQIIVFPTVEKLAEYFYQLLRSKIPDISKNMFFNVALSGGSTPKMIFKYLSAHSEGEIDWKKIKLFWSDERCVAPDDEESNFRMTSMNLIENIDIPVENIFRIYGENDPENEAIRYSSVLQENVGLSNGLPRFDMLLLGLGEDGHTASIFPGNHSLFQSSNYCQAVKHPESGQSRITLTGPVINNAELVVFMVIGAGKAEIVAKLLNNDHKSELPASFVRPANGNSLWLLDDEAAKLLDTSLIKKV